MNNASGVVDSRSTNRTSATTVRSSRIKAYNIADLRALAKRALPKGLFQFVDRGTENEYALQRMRAGIDRLAIRPKVLVNVSQRTQETQFFGIPSAMPLAVAPTGAAGLLWYDGEIEIARAAARMGIPFTLSTASIVSMERVASEAGGRLWFQLYMWPERSMSYELIDRVKAAGYEALVVTVDTPVTPNREYNTHNGFTLPMRVNRRNAVDVACHPGWLVRVFLRYMLSSGIPSLENYPESLKRRLSQAPSPIKCDSLCWNDLKEIRKRWNGPLIVKGILRPEDAQQARDCGADGIVVSNHGGRNLDASISPFAALPAILEQVRGQMEVMIDGGMSRGSDVIKAIALGANGAFVGRAPLWGVAVDGEAGAYLALRILYEEIDRIQAFAGAPSLSDLDVGLLRLDPN